MAPVLNTTFVCRTAMAVILTPISNATLTTVCNIVVTAFATNVFESQRADQTQSKVQLPPKHIRLHLVLGKKSLSQ
jgi:hypothetical protein